MGPDQGVRDAAHHRVPAGHRGRYRLDTLRAWEDRQLAASTVAAPKPSVDTAAPALAPAELSPVRRSRTTHTGTKRQTLVSR